MHAAKPHPDVFVGIDAKEFNLSLSRRLRAAGLLTVQYVSPQVWAWRPKRVRRLHEAGAILALGTDKSHAPLALRELELLTEASIPAADVVTIATRNAAIYLGVADRLGTLEVGKAADLLLLRADPTRDIRNVRQIEAVIKAGTVVDRARLDVPANGSRSVPGTVAVK